MTAPVLSPSAHTDSFCRDNLPPAEVWPEMIFDLPELHYPDRLNCAAALLDSAVAEGHGERVAVITADRRYSYRDMQSLANRIAHVLTQDLALVPGNRLLLRAPNTPMLLAAWFGALKAGLVVVTTMPLLRAKELVEIVDKGEITAALCDAGLMEDMREAQAKSPRLARVVTMGADPDGAHELDSLMAGKSDVFAAVETAADDVALLAFTSGTTGMPKACIHFHRDVLAMADTFSRHVLRPVQDDVFCGTPPIAFTFGLGASVVFPFHARAATALINKASPEVLIENIGRLGVTALFTAPTAYRAMLGMLERYDISGLRRCVSAGEALPKPTWDAWHAATGMKIIDGIGATEMIHIFISASDDDIRPGATGKAVPGYVATVLDEDGQEVPPDTVGRLAVRGPTGCRYLADDRQTKYVQNGWNITGDAYKRDADGYFWFQARADDMIISSGYNIAGPEVEAALLSHSDVAECAVVGAPDEDRGFIVKAFIVPAEGTPRDADQIKRLQDHVKSCIAPYKYPRAIDFVDALPKTQTGKVQRFKLRQGQ